MAEGYERLRATVAANIRRVRAAKRMSQEKLALDSGVHRTYLSQIECEKKNPTLEVLYRLAQILDTPLIDLIKEEEKA